MTSQCPARLVEVRPARAPSYRSGGGILASGFFIVIVRTRKDRYGLPLVTTGQFVEALLARVADRIGVAYPPPSCSL